MDLISVLSITSTVIDLLQLSSSVASYPVGSVSDLIALLRLYGISGYFVWAYGSQSVWRMQAKLLGSFNDNDAMAFRKSMQDECTMTAVAAAIVAQIAITALSLPFLSQAHWVARGSWIFSLISGIMAVYYTGTQQRIMGRLLYPQQVRAWIRGKGGLYQPFDPDAYLSDPDYRSRWGLTRWMLNKLTEPGNSTIMRSAYSRSFSPSPASVITISAPQLLLSASLNSFLVGLGVYQGFVWHRNLDPNAGPNDSRNVFIIYIVSVGLCYVVYSLSTAVQDEQSPSTNPYLLVLESTQSFLERASHFVNEDHPIETQAANIEHLSARASESAADSNLSLARPPFGGEPPGAPSNPMQVSDDSAAPQPPNLHVDPESRRTVEVAGTPALSKTQLNAQNYDQLIQALQESARLKRESAKAEDVVAQCYKQLISPQDPEKR